MNVRAKLILLLSFTLGFIFFVVIGFRYLESNQRKVFLDAMRDGRRMIIDNVLRINEENSMQSAFDYSGWDDMVDNVNNPSPIWLEENIHSMLTTFKFNFVWIYNSDMKLVYSTSDSIIILPNLPVPHLALLELSNDKPFIHFFLDYQGSIIEVFGAIIVPSADLPSRKSKPQGYFFVAKIWNSNYLSELEESTDLNITIHYNRKKPTCNQNDINIRRQFYSWNNRMVFEADFHYRSNYIKEWNRLSNQSLYIIILLTFLTTLLFLYFTRIWISKPIRMISDGLDNRSIIPIKPLLSEDSEFGNIAIMMEQYFAQQELLQNEVELHKNTSAKLKINQKELNDVIATKDKFFSIIAHDLKNPLNAVIGFAEMISRNIDKLDKAKIEEYVRQINDISKHGYSLLENLLEWSRAQTGSIEFIPATLNVAELVNDQMQLFKAQANKKSIELSYQIDSSIQVIADKNMLRTIIRNLLTNAIKYTNINGRINIYAASYEKYAVITVADNGVGISDNDKSRIFNVGAHFTTYGTANEQGTGLGLTLCKEFIMRNGGKIWVDSELGKGSTFSFTLPIPI